jgi:HAD superfamily hydrolase (TIGR01549 family)
MWYNIYSFKILSNGFWSIIILKENKLEEIFDTIIISSNKKMVKPNLNIYRYIISKMNVKSEQCLMIEDRR